MTFQFRPAKRSEAKPLVGLYAESGAGKTLSALLLARGFVGPKGRIGMIETESGRGEAYADPIEYPELAGPDPKSNYEVLPLRDDFSPKTYGEALDAAEKTKLDALIIDSASHEWEGKGGVLQMAAANQAQYRKGPQIWQQPKQDHQQHFMLRFTQTPIPLVILCMRARYPMREVTKPGGGKEWVKSDSLVPKQADDILSEMLLHGWIGQGDHIFHKMKCTGKFLEPVFKENTPISVKTGQALAVWAQERAQAEADKATATPTGAASPPTLVPVPYDDGANGSDWAAWSGSVKKALANAPANDPAWADKWQELNQAALKNLSALPNGKGAHDAILDRLDEIRGKVSAE